MTEQEKDEPQQKPSSKKELKSTLEEVHSTLLKASEEADRKLGLLPREKK